MPASNPLTAIDILIADQFNYFAPLLALIPAARQQKFDKLVDIRGDLEDAADFGGRLVLIPSDTRIEPAYSSSSARLELEYEIILGVGDLKVEDLRKIEWEIIRACVRLFKGIGPTGALLDPNAADPLQWESFHLVRSEPAREPIGDPEEWRSVCRLVAVAFAAHDAMTA